MANAAQLSGGDLDQEAPPQNIANLNSLPSQGPNLPTDVQVDTAKKVVQDPPTTQENLTQDSVPPYEIILVEEEKAPAESGVPGVKGIQTGIVAEVADAKAASQEENIKEKGNG